MLLEARFDTRARVRLKPVREAAALQTFPDDYRFLRGVVSQREQVGNAVPPMLAEHIARVVRGSLEDQAMGR
jgi:DNA (cytosine-5)-methyltransferase 1